MVEGKLVKNLFGSRKLKFNEVVIRTWNFPVSNFQHYQVSISNDKKKKGPLKKTKNEMIQSKYEQKGLFIITML